MLIAALTVEIFARVLERCGVRCEVLGFTTREWDGGEPARDWAADGYPENPGRLNALEHIVIKHADVPWRRARQALGLFLHEEILKENIDGEAVSWAHGRLLGRTEARRILVVVSDGTPMDEATLAANGYEYLDQHLKSVVEGIERVVAGAARRDRHRPRRLDHLLQRHDHRPHRSSRAGAHREADRAARRQRRRPPSPRVRRRR